MDGATVENHSLMFKLQSDKDKIIQSGELPAKTPQGQNLIW